MKSKYIVNLVLSILELLICITGIVLYCVLDKGSISNLLFCSVMGISAIFNIVSIITSLQTDKLIETIK